MKISVPTNVTITSMQAVNGSSTQPMRRVASGVAPNWNHGIFRSARTVSAPACGWSVVRKAVKERTNESTIAPTATFQAKARCGCLVRARIPAASNGRTGINHRYCRARSMVSALHRIDLIEVGGFVVAINGNDQRQTDGCLGCGNRDGKNDEHHAGQMM